MSTIKKALENKAGRRLLASELPIESRFGLGYRVSARGLIVRVGAARPPDPEDGQSLSSAR